MSDLDPSLMVGTWTIERDLLDRASGLAGTFVGELVISQAAASGGATDAEPMDADLTWQESGALHWNGQTVPAHRLLLLRRLDRGSADGGDWWMRFADGRPFHRWAIDEPVVHPCAADTYRGLITTSAHSDGSTPTELTITWDVTGPTKDQLIVSRLSRLS